MIPYSERGDKIVITGMATINPLGDTLEEFIDNLLNGVSGVKPLRTVDVTHLNCKIGGDLGDYDFTPSVRSYEKLMDRKHYKATEKLFRRAPFATKTAMAVALGAFRDGKLFDYDFDRARCAAIVAGHNFNSAYIYANSRQYLKEPDYIDGLAGVHAIDSDVPGCVTEATQVYGPSFSVGGACASGNLALREAFRGIVLNDFDRALVVGAAFDFSAPDLYASEFINATVIDPVFQDQPERASRPFDQARSGFVYSHGAGAVLIEREQDALRRGANIYAEVLAVEANSNGNHLPQPDSKMQSLLIQQLLQQSELKPNAVDYVNCHATGTPLGDIQEANAIKDAFGDYAKHIKVNAPKSMLGHVCWTAPIVEMIGGILQMQRKRLHPTINIDNLDPVIGLDVCPNYSVDFAAKIMLNNSFGFGGLNCSALVRYYE